jgi:hypothetical protein
MCIGSVPSLVPSPHHPRCYAGSISLFSWWSSYRHKWRLRNKLRQFLFMKKGTLLLPRCNVYHIYCSLVLSCVWVWLQTGFGLMIGFIGLLDTEHDCTLQFAITHSLTYSLMSTQVFTSCCLVVAFNGGCSPSSEFPIGPQPQLLASHSNSS